MAGRGAEEEESKPIHGIDLGTWLQKKLENLSAAPGRFHCRPCGRNRRRRAPCTAPAGTLGPRATNHCDLRRSSYTVAAHCCLSYLRRPPCGRSRRHRDRPRRDRAATHHHHTMDGRGRTTPTPAPLLLVLFRPDPRRFLPRSPSVTINDRKLPISR